MRFLGLSSKIGQKRTFYGKRGSVPYGFGRLCIAGDVKHGPSLQFETGGEESGCQFAFMEGGRNQTD